MLKPEVIKALLVECHVYHSGTPYHITFVKMILKKLEKNAYTLIQLPEDRAKRLAEKFDNITINNITCSSGCRIVRIYNQ